MLHFSLQASPRPVGSLMYTVLQPYKLAFRVSPFFQSDFFLQEYFRLVIARNFFCKNFYLQYGVQDEFFFVVVILWGGGSDLVSVFCDSVWTCVCFSVLDVINEEASK